MATLKITERPQVQALKNGASLLITQQETVDGQPVESLRRIEANPLLAPPIITTATDSIVTIMDGAARPAVELISHIEPVQSGSGDPSPDNVRPISGRNAAQIWVTGKNLIDISALVQAGDDGVASITRVSLPMESRPFVWAGVKYTARFNRKDNYDRMFVTITDGNNVTLEVIQDGADANNGGLTFTPTCSGYLSVMFGRRNTAMTGWMEQTLARIQSMTPWVECGDATAYEPYNGKTLSATLPEAVYGGDMYWLTGVLENYGHKLVIDGTNMAVAKHESANGVYVIYNIGAYGHPLPAVGGAMACSHFPVGEVGANNIHVSPNNNGTIYLGSVPGISDEAAYNAWLANNPITCVYRAAEPEEIQLTPQQLSTLHGVNNVWSSTGDTTLSYIADTELWSKTAATSMIGAVEPSMVASKNYASGDFIVVQDAMALYRATVPIAKGEAIKPGTNCTATTVVEQIAALYSLINR